MSKVAVLSLVTVLWLGTVKCCMGGNPLPKKSDSKRIKVTKLIYNQGCGDVGTALPLCFTLTCLEDAYFYSASFHTSFVVLHPGLYLVSVTRLVTGRFGMSLPQL